MSHIFLSYARQDSLFTHDIADYLVRSGFDVWIDDRNIDFGDDWEFSIFRAIEGCAVFVVVMTPTSAKSRWVRRECIHADKLEKPIIPLLRGGEPFPFYGEIQYVDVTAPGVTLPPAFLKLLAQHAVRRNTPGHNIALSVASSSSHSFAPRPQFRRLGLVSFAIFVVVLLSAILLLALGNMASKTNATQTASELVNAPTEAREALVSATPILTDTPITQDNTLSEGTLTTEIASSLALSPQVTSADTESPSATTAIYLSPTLLVTPLIFTPTQIQMTRFPTQVSNFKPLITSAPLPQTGVSAPIVNQNSSPLPTTIVLPTQQGNNNPNPPTATKRPVSTNTPKPPTATRTPSNTPTLTLTPTVTSTTNPGALQLVSSFIAPGGLPNGITCDGQFLWLSDNSATIFKVDMSGNVLGAYNAPEATPQGIIWVGDRFYITTTSRGRVYAFQVQGINLNTLSWFESPSQVVGGNSDDMAWDGSNIWYSNYYNVYKLDLSGTIVDGFASGKVVNGLAWDGTNLWLATDYSSKMLQVNGQGQVLATFQAPVSQIEGLDWCNNSFWAIGRDQVAGDMKVYQLRR